MKCFANMGLGEYLKLYEPKAREMKEAGKPLPGYVLRWLDWLDTDKAE